MFFLPALSFSFIPLLPKRFSLYLLHLLRNSATLPTVFFHPFFDIRLLFEFLFIRSVPYPFFSIISSSISNSPAMLRKPVPEADCGQPADQHGLKRSVLLLLLLDIDCGLSKVVTVELWTLLCLQCPTHCPYSPPCLQRSLELPFHLRGSDCWWSKVLAVALHVHHQGWGPWIAHEPLLSIYVQVKEPSVDPSPSPGLSSKKPGGPRSSAIERSPVPFHDNTGRRYGLETSSCENLDGWRMATCPADRKCQTPSTLLIFRTYLWAWTSFWHHGINYSSGLLSVTVVPLFKEPFSALDIAHTEHGRWALLENCWVGVGVLNGRHRLKQISILNRLSTLAVKYAQGKFRLG